MTFVVQVDSMDNIEQVTKQLNKQVDVLKVKDITDEAIIARELALIKILVSPQQRAEVAALVHTLSYPINDSRLFPAFVLNVVQLVSER